MGEIKGILFQVTRCTVDDGPGIRTSVFLKGCPLRCAWCHNPESQHTAPELLFKAAACTGCGACAAACPKGCHSMGEEGHRFDPTGCIGCGACAAACPGKALRLCGYETTVEELLKLVLRDRMFYETSGGGVTLTGGEPLFQPEFTTAFLKAAKEAGLHTCIETCGFASPGVLEQVLPYVDLFLFDMKHPESDAHQALTGVPNGPILQNLRRIADHDLILRMPVVPGCNDSRESLLAVAELVKTLPGCRYLQLMPYHDYGKIKYTQLGREYPAAQVPTPTTRQEEAYLALLREAGLGERVVLHKETV